MWRGLAILAVLLIILVIGSSWAVLSLGPPPTKAITYRQTVTIQGPSGPVSASGVFQEVIRYTGNVLGQSGPSMFSYVNGEALAFDIPTVGLVVQTIVRRPTVENNRMGTVISDACGVSSPNVNSRPDAMSWLDELDEAFASACQLPVDKSQLIVVFREVGPPADATAYLPEYLPRDLRITSIVIERTTEAVSYGLLSSSLWKRNVGDPIQQLIIEPRDSERSAALSLHESSFVNR